MHNCFSSSRDPILVIFDDMIEGLTPLIIRPWDPSSLQYNLAAGRFYCKGYSELTLTYTRIKNALRKFVFALIDFSKFEDLNCFAPCDRSPNLAATNFPPNFGQICTARYPMISEWPQKKRRV